MRFRWFKRKREKAPQQQVDKPETFPKVSKSTVPGDIPWNEWINGKWIKEERKPINEILKEIK